MFSVEFIFTQAGKLKTGTIGILWTTAQLYDLIKMPNTVRKLKSAGKALRTPVVGKPAELNHSPVWLSHIEDPDGLASRALSGKIIVTSTDSRSCKMIAPRPAETGHLPIDLSLSNGGKLKVILQVPKEFWFDAIQNCPEIRQRFFAELQQKKGLPYSFFNNRVYRPDSPVPGTQEPEPVAYLPCERGFSGASGALVFCPKETRIKTEREFSLALAEAFALFSAYLESVTKYRTSIQRFENLGIPLKLMGECPLTSGAKCDLKSMTGYFNRMHAAIVQSCINKDRDGIPLLRSSDFSTVRDGDEAIVREILSRLLRLKEGQRLKVAEVFAGGSFGNGDLGCPWIARALAMAFPDHLDLIAIDRVDSNRLWPRFEKEYFGLTVLPGVTLEEWSAKQEQATFELIFCRHGEPLSGNEESEYCSSIRPLLSQNGVALLYFDMITSAVGGLFRGIHETKQIVLGTPLSVKAA